LLLAFEAISSSSSDVEEWIRVLSFFAGSMASLASEHMFVTRSTKIVTG
jgi:hypothetical protein